MRTLKKLKSLDLPHATLASIGIEIKAKDNVDTEGIEDEIQQTVAEANEYLKNFCSPGKCPGCDSKLGGLLGTFQWGIANGEGHCSVCLYPVRAYHRDAGPFEFFEALLPYHPSVLQKKRNRF